LLSERGFMAALIKISEAISLAFHSLAILAREPDTPMSTQAIAEALGASSAHLAKVLQKLEHQEFLTSIRGPGGGYSLAHDPGTIFLKDIFEAMDGPIGNQNRLLDAPFCEGGKCLFGNMLASLESQMRDHLESTSLNDLSRSMGWKSA